MSARGLTRTKRIQSDHHLANAADTAAAGDGDGGVDGAIDFYGVGSMAL